MVSSLSVPLAAEETNEETSEKVTLEKSFFYRKSQKGFPLQTTNVSTLAHFHVHVLFSIQAVTVPQFVLFNWQASDAGQVVDKFLYLQCK